MKAKDQQPYMLDDELGSREEVEVHEQRIKELEEYNEQGGEVLIIKLSFLQLC